MCSPLYSLFSLLTIRRSITASDHSRRQRFVIGWHYVRCLIIIIKQKVERMESVGIWIIAFIWIQFPRRHYWTSTLSRMRPYGLRTRTAQMYHMKHFSFQLISKTCSQRRFIILVFLMLILTSCSSVLHRSTPVTANRSRVSPRSILHYPQLLLVRHSLL